MAKQAEPRQQADLTTEQPQTVGRTVTVSFSVSEALHTSVKVRAAQERTTVRGMMMKGLKAIGLDVPEEDLVDRRPGRSGRKDR